MLQSFNVTIRAICTDAASAITATELDNLKQDLRVKFEVLGRYRWHVDSAAERYIKGVFGTAIIALIRFATQLSLVVR